MDEETEVKQILWSTNVELDHFLKKLEIGSYRLTDQDLESVVNVLERRCRAIGARLRKILTQNNNYRIPRQLKKQILQDILDLQERAIKARVEMATGQQAAFWGVLRKLEQTLDSHKVVQSEQNNDLQEAA